MIFLIELIHRYYSAMQSKTVQFKKSNQESGMKQIKVKFRDAKETDNLLDAKAYESIVA